MSPPSKEVRPRVCGGVIPHTVTKQDMIDRLGFTEHDAEEVVRFRRHLSGDTNDAAPCRITECEEPDYGDGFCASHGPADVRCPNCGRSSCGHCDGINYDD